MPPNRVAFFIAEKPHMHRYDTQVVPYFKGYSRIAHLITCKVNTGSLMAPGVVDLVFGVDHVVNIPICNEQGVVLRFVG